MAAFSATYKPNQIKKFQNLLGQAKILSAHKEEENKETK